MNIEESNILAAYEAANDETKNVLRALFPEQLARPAVDNRPVTERIKTFEDAIAALGEDHLFVRMFRDIYEKSEIAGANVNDDVVTYLKLRVIAAALNEGWEPQFTEDEFRYYPYFFLYTQEELYEKSDEWKQAHKVLPLDGVLFGGYAHDGAYAGFAFAGSIYAPSNPDANFGSRLCFKSRELAVYAGNQFADLYLHFLIK